MDWGTSVMIWRCRWVCKNILIALLVVSIVLPSQPVPVSAAVTSRVRSVAAAPSDLPWLDPALLRALADAGTLPLSVIITLRAPGHFSFSSLPAEPQAARLALTTALKERFAISRAPLETFFLQTQRSGELWALQDLWIINGLALTAQPALIRQLALQPAVATVRLDQRRLYLDPALAVAPDASSATADVEWGVDRIRAPEAWSTLGVTGEGAVVAGVDTGVDYQHPALNANYRGNLGYGAFEHRHAWFDAVSGGAYPYDDHGHGSHSLGTAVGQGGIGVAPDARWIAVKMLSSSGYGQDSWIHAGLQWLLAPGGDPLLAPDVVVCSWGSTNAWDETLAPDLAALRAAGILVVFAAGNEGPVAGSLRSPASLPGVLAVGASDQYEAVASFSSRGPSPWGEIKPNVVAPGVNVRSAAPGGVYAEMNGTSMATPHVAGIGALLRSITPTISVPLLTYVITATAVPYTTTLPNNESGWGRVDALAAVRMVLQPGRIVGTVRSSSGMPVRGATVQVTPRQLPGASATVATDAAGNYQFLLPPSLYNLTAMAFGYFPQSQLGVRVFTDTITRVDFQLPAMPAGEVRGQVTVLASGAPPTRPVTIRALNTPVTTAVDVSGVYNLHLPTGVYTLEACGNGYRLATASVTVTLEGPVTQDFLLEVAPTLLLVDQGALYYNSKIGFWTGALDALGYAYDLWTITALPLPENLLAPYDVILWSAPIGSPGLVAAGEMLETYLDDGGRLLLSGQDVAYFDSGSGMSIAPQSYLKQLLGVNFVADDTASRTVIGAGPFAGLSANIAGGDGANNQISPDVIAVEEPELAEVSWQYANGSVAGLMTHLCTEYRALFWAFGFEGLASMEARTTSLQRALTWLGTPQPASGLRFTTLDGRDPGSPLLIASPGETVTHTLRLRHIGVAGTADSVTLMLSPASWVTVLTPTVVTLEPCEAITVSLRVTVPITASVDVDDVITLTARSSLGAAPVDVVLRTKTAASLLLVDDDRWYPMEHFYTSALQSAGIRFDVWNTSVANTGNPFESAVTPELLARYPVVLWFTGYDWYAPVTDAEEQQLLDYLDQGGRLLLSSQDFLANGSSRPLGVRLGVNFPNVDFKIKQASGVADHPASGAWGPAELLYSFPNWSDALEPSRAASIAARGQLGQPVALSATGVASGTWRTLFYAFPLEALPASTRVKALERGVGWLSPLGASHWRVEPAMPQPGVPVTLTLALRNDAPIATEVAFTHTVPPSLTLLASTLPPDLAFDASARQVTWSGMVTPGAPVTYTWRALTPEVPAVFTSAVMLELPTLKLGFSREAEVRVGNSDLGASDWSATPPLEEDQPAELSFVLRNTGIAPVTEGVLRLWLRPGVAPLTATVVPTRGMALQPWRGALGSGETTTVTVTVLPWLGGVPLRVDALLDAGNGATWERSLWFQAIPPDIYLPLVFRQEP
ncbi:MAG: S8 family serine peptidase [Anaerolineae bacterium]|nr:S8 family serine peptidase [Anaerolineae bacterium]